MGLFKKRKPKDEKADKHVMQMVTTYGEHFYAWNGKLFDSDIVRSCIRPKVKAAGKLAGKHIRATLEQRRMKCTQHDVGHFDIALELARYVVG